MKNLLALLITCSLAVSAAFAISQDKPAQVPAASIAKSAAALDDKVVIATQLPSYPLSKCLVSDEALDAKNTFNLVHEGRLYRLCCEMCADAVKKDSAKYKAAIEAAVIAAQKPSYPVDVCAVSGEKLGGMGEPIDYVYGTRLVRFCCEGCIKSFEKSPSASLAQIDAALIAQQLKTYPTTTCLVSGEALEEGKTVDHLYGVRLVRLCCKNCVRALEKDPGAVLAKLDAAAKAK